MTGGIQPEDIQPFNPEQQRIKMDRPLLLSVFCLFSVIYFSLVALMFLAGTIYSRFISEVVNLYVPEGFHHPWMVRLFFVTGFFLHVLGIAGTLMIRKLRKKGYYLLTSICITVAVIQLFLPEIKVTTTAIYILLILLFGLFYRRLR